MHVKIYTFKTRNKKLEPWVEELGMNYAILVEA